MSGRAVLFAVAFGLVTGACRPTGTETPKRGIRIATGNPSGVYYPLGKALARIYTDSVPGIYASAELTAGSDFNVKSLDEGSVDLAFSAANVVYTAYMHGTSLNPRPHRRLRGIAVVYVNALHLVVRRDSPFNRVVDLRGARIGYGSETALAAVAMSATRSTRFDPVRAGDDLSARDIRAIRMATFEEIAAALAAGKLEIGLIMAGYPVTAVSTLASDGRIRLLEIDLATAQRIRAQYPFLKPTLIPADVYGGQQEPVNTIGTDNLMVCREDLGEDLVYRLTRAFFETLPRLAETHEVARQVDPDVAPATPIPLHPGAARYYRERELLR